jgi:NAD(P)-dependent dehydrogenase (short-subunit alcohol dehydrogenase family)
VTIITGGGRGIGAAVATALAEAGHDVVINYLSARDRAAETADLVRAAGRQAVIVEGDVSVESDVDRLFDVAAAALGPVTGLVNNAGVTGRLTDLADVSIETIRRVIDVNVIGSLLCARRAVREMAGRGGAIVNVSSAAATLGSPNEYIHYAAAKGAVDSMTIGMAKEFGPLGIRVNAVSPGRTWTEIHADMGDPDRPGKIDDIAPLRRAAMPAEVAAAIVWLLSDAASYTTGANIRVAGGL